MFSPFLAYGVSTWGLTYLSMLDPNLISEKKIIRIITFSEATAPSGPIFDSLQILKLNDVIVMHIVSFVYECVHSLDPACFKNYFTRIHNAVTEGDQFPLRCNTIQYGLRSIHFSGVRHWNSLLQNIRDSNYLFFVKFWKKMMHKGLYSFLESNKVNTPCSLAFEANIPQLILTISMTENIRNTIDNGNC